MTQTIPASGRNYLSTGDASREDQIALARDAWQDGQLDNALLILDSLEPCDLPPAQLVDFCVVKATVLASKGRWYASLEELARAAPGLDAAPQRLQGCFFNQRAWANKNLGRIDEALTDYAGAQALFRLAGAFDYEAAVANNLACLALAIGDYAQAADCADRAIELYKGMGLAAHLARTYDTKANILLAQGRPELALNVIESALALNDDNQNWIAEALTTRGKIKANLADWTARADFDKAIEIAEAIGSDSAIAAACAAVIKGLPLPLADLVEYYRKADLHESPELRECARVIINAIPNATIEDMEVDMVRRALIKSEGSITKAAQIVGLTHKGVDYVINRHPGQLLHLRKVRQVRHKSIIGKK